MKKIVLFVFFTVGVSVYSQGIYLKTGVNHTTYNYKTETGEKNDVLQSGLGNAYELGYRAPLFHSTRFSVDVGLVFNGYNAVVGVPNASLKWNTGFVGVQSTFVCSVVKIGSLSLDLKTGGGLNTVLYGKEDVNGIVYDIKGNDDFSGVVFQGLFGVQANIKASEYCHLSIGYNLSRSMSNVKKPQEFYFENGQIMLGIHLMIVKKVD